MTKNKIESIVIIALFLLIVGSIMFFGLCRGILVDESVATKALEKQGYTEIEIINHDWFLIGFRGCDKNDAAKITAIAKNPIGQEVEVFVCCGWPFKGATIRSA